MTINVRRAAKFVAGGLVLSGALVSAYAFGTYLGTTTRAYQQGDAIIAAAVNYPGPTRDVSGNIFFLHGSPMTEGHHLIWSAYFLPHTGGEVDRECLEKAVGVYNTQHNAGVRAFPGYNSDDTLAGFDIGTVTSGGGSTSTSEQVRDLAEKCAT